MDGKNCTISVIMPAFNAEKTIERSIQSVLLQTRKDWELLIVDDASKDKTYEIIQSLADTDHRIKITRLPANSGAAISRNTALALAKGRYIAFLDADDEWSSDKLKKQIEWMEANNIEFSCTAYNRVKNGKTVKTIYVPARSSKSQLLKNNTVATLTAIYDQHKLPNMEMVDIRRRQDYAFWLDLLDKTDSVYGLNEVLAFYHIGHESLSSNKLIAARDQWKFYGNVLGMNFFQRLWYFVHYAINATRRSL